MVSTRRHNAQPIQDKREKLPKSMLGERFVTTYDPVKALEVVEQLAEGLTLNKICQGVPGMPSARTFKRWVVNNPDLAKAYASAIVVSASSLEEEALDTARLIAMSPKDGTHVRAAEVKITQLRWSAERRDASKFGQRNQINLRVPVQIITSLNLGDQGDSIPAESIYTLDLTPTATLVEEKPIPPTHGSHKGPRKKVLTPRSPGIAGNPFYKIAQGISHETTDVRPEGNQQGQRLLSGPRDEGLHQPRPEAAPLQQETLHPGEVTEGGREDK